MGIHRLPSLIEHQSLVSLKVFLIKPKMVRYISIFYVTVLAVIFLFPTNGKPIPEDYQANEPAEKQNQNKKYLLVQIPGPTKGKGRNLAGAIAEAGIGIGKAVFCKEADEAKARNLEMLGQFGKALFC